MKKADLYFNILTFDWPKEPLTFYFSTDKTVHSHKLGKYHFPDNISDIFPDILEKEDPVIYTTFTEPVEGFQPFELNIRDIKLDLYKRFLNIQIDKHFRNKGFIVTKNFVKDRQIWVKSSNLSTEIYTIYNKFSLKIQFKKVSEYPELIVAYDGKSKVLNKSISKLNMDISSILFKKVIHKTYIYNYQKVNDSLYQKLEPNNTFPLLNNDLSNALGIRYNTTRIPNKYKPYKEAIDTFIKHFILKDDFIKIIPINTKQYLQVPKINIGYVNNACNDLVFEGGLIGRIPKTDFATKKPFEISPHRNIEFFYIFHVSHKNEVIRLDKYLKKGINHYFKGLDDYAKVPYHADKNFAIQYQNSDNPLPEIINKLNDFTFNSNITYVAIYISPIDKYHRDKSKKKVYYRVKEELLKRRIVSQVIDYQKLRKKISNYQYELNNISLALLAKLQGKPWQLATSSNRELIIGVGAFKNIDENINYIASAFSFQNNGNFNGFDYFTKSNTIELSGAISNAITQFHAIEDNPSKVVIHFYKEMSKQEMDPIIKRMEQLELGCPLYIININKTDSQDLIAFDLNWHNRLMPKSGTFIKIGWNQFLLFNNSRYNDFDSYPTGESYPFPIKLSISSPTEDALDDIKTVKNLIEQVYQFSRLYWKSLRQQNVPITIKYPEMVAEIAPHFEGDDIPPHGKDVLWFL